MDKSESETVLYCAECLSLAVIGTVFGDCCKECGSTNIIEAPFKEWDILYRKKYGKSYIERSNEIKNKHH